MMSALTLSLQLAVLLLLLLQLHMPLADAIRWLALGRADAGAGAWNSSQCRWGWGLSGRQAAVCRGALDAMPQVARAARAAVTTCHQLFAGRRWNCSSLAAAPALGPDLTTGTREQAYAYALSSAAVTHAVARACAQGELVHCSCAGPPRDPPNGNFKWGGCGDNVRYAAAIGRRFTDAAERRRQRGAGAGAGAMYSVTDVRRKKRVQAEAQGHRAQLSLVNLHNNRAGRRAVEDSEATQCKCHGVSGSCNIKTCWRALPRLQDVGLRLQRRFAEAVEVEPRPPRRRLVAVAPARTHSQEDLIFLTKSPDYCEADPRTGSLGTRGRSCNSSSSGFDSCQDMCCGRGYRTAVVERSERCHCKYYWCCYVRCSTCTSWVEEHECL